VERRVYDIAEEPRGEVYHKLIDISLSFCDTGVLVVRDTIRLGETGAQVLEALRAFVRSQSRKSSWPGTVLEGNLATVYRFRLCEDSIRILKDCVDSLYDWQQPDLPEDLCLIRPDESPWLVSTAHEGDSYLDITPQEKDHIVAQLPALEPLRLHTESK